MPIPQKGKLAVQLKRVTETHVVHVVTQITSPLIANGGAKAPAISATNLATPIKSVGATLKMGVKDRSVIDRKTRNLTTNTKVKSVLKEEKTLI